MYSDVIFDAAEEAIVAERFIEIYSANKVQCEITLRNSFIILGEPKNSRECARKSAFDALLPYIRFRFLDQVYRLPKTIKYSPNHVYTKQQAVKRTRMSYNAYAKLLNNCVLRTQDIAGYLIEDLDTSEKFWVDEDTAEKMYTAIGY